MDSDPVAYLAAKGHHGRPAAGGREMTYPCFFDCAEPADSRKRKLYLSIDTGLYNCKVCGVRGGPTTLARHFGDEVAPTPPGGPDPAGRAALLDAAARSATDMLLANEPLMTYLVSTGDTLYGPGRGLTAETVLARRLGYAGGRHWSLTGTIDRIVTSRDVLRASGLVIPDGPRAGQDTFTDHLLIPYLSRGQVTALRGRNMTGTGPRYLTPSGAAVTVYDPDTLDDADETIICEGEFDAMILAQTLAASGDERLARIAVIALPGAGAVPAGFTDMLTRTRRRWIGFDNDTAGIKAAAKLAATLPQPGTRTLTIPTGKDWTDYLTRGGGNAESIAGLLSAASGRRVFTVRESGASWRKQRATVGGLATGYAGLDATLTPGILPGQIAIVLARTGSGKQNDVDEIIPTPGGWRRFGDLQPGDQVFGRDGAPTTVIGVHPQTDRRAWKVTFSDRTSLVAGPEHLWQVYQRGGHAGRWLPQVLTTEQILAAGLWRDGGQQRGWRFIIPMPGPVQYPKRNDLPIGAYTLGALLANGCLGGTGAVLSTPDEQVAARCGTEHVVHPNKAPEGACPRYGVLGVMPAVRDLGIAVGSRDKFIPERYLLADVDTRIALLQGLMDGDGGARDSGRASVMYYTTSRRLAADVQRLVWSLGGTAMVRWLDRGPKGIDGTVAIMLPDSIDPFSTPRKVRGRARKHTEPRRAIVSIEPVADRDMQCISVDAPDALYQIGDAHIVTHNTIMLCNLAYNMRGRRTLLFSLEMTREECYERLRRIHLFWHPNATDAEIDSSYHNLMICDENRVTPEGWNSALEEYHDEVGAWPDVVMVDYLGYYARGHPGSNRYEQVSNAVMTLKGAAKGGDSQDPERRFALIVPGQVNRTARPGAPIEVDDARDSGGIGETADFLLALWRPDDALATPGPGAGTPAPTGALRLTVLKSRHGGVGREFRLVMDLLSLAIVDADSPAAHRAAEHNTLAHFGHTWASLQERRSPAQLRLAT